MWSITLLSFYKDFLCLSMSLARQKGSKYVKLCRNVDIYIATVAEENKSLIINSSSLHWWGHVDCDRILTSSPLEKVRWNFDESWGDFRWLDMCCITTKYFPTLGTCISINKQSELMGALIQSPVSLTPII